MKQSEPLDIIMLGLATASPRRHARAANLLGLARGLARMGHRVQFLERDVPWFSFPREENDAEAGRVQLYRSLDELRDCFADAVRFADVVLLGSHVAQGAEIARWIAQTALGVTAFYDFDAPATLAKLSAGDHEYIEPPVIPRFDLYLSVTGGPVLAALERRWGAVRARALHAFVDAVRYRPAAVGLRADLGCLGDHCDGGIQPVFEQLFLETARQCPAGRFTVAGAAAADRSNWPENVRCVQHPVPLERAVFYGSHRFVLCITGANASDSPGSELTVLEAAACGAVIVAPRSSGLEQFLKANREFLPAETTGEVIAIMTAMPFQACRQIGRAARLRVLSGHTAVHRAAALERLLLDAIAGDTKETSRGRKSAAREPVHA